VCLVNDVEVKLLVGTANSSNVGRVLRPIERSDEGVMLSKRLVEGVGTVSDRVDVEDVVMGSSCEVITAWGVACNFAPFLSFFQRCDLVVKIVEISDGYLTHVTADNDVTVLCGVADSSCLLVGRVERH